MWGERGSVLPPPRLSGGGKLSLRLLELADIDINDDDGSKDFGELDEEAVAGAYCAS